MTSINVPSKNFLQSALAQKPTSKLTTRERAEAMSELREKEILLIYISRKVGSTSEVQMHHG